MMFDEEKTEKKEKKEGKEENETPRYPTFLGNFKLFINAPPFRTKSNICLHHKKNQFYRD